LSKNSISMILHLRIGSKSTKASTKSQNNLIMVCSFFHSLFLFLCNSIQKLDLRPRWEVAIFIYMLFDKIFVLFL
jgi:hypothetical protein